MLSPRVRHTLARRINRVVQATGYTVVSNQTRQQIGRTDIDSDQEFMSAYERCRSYTMTPIERMYALFKATEYVSEHGVVGDIVECGVWRGGSSALVAHRLQEHGDTSRRLFLYDTYTGMSAPDERDVDRWGRNAADLLSVSTNKDEIWCYAQLDEVAAVMAHTGYPNSKIELVQGRVEDTIPDRTPASIALLRLDTDWYESTYHELVHLYPRLTPGGVLIIDDYGWWQGARQAVDRYLAETSARILLNRIDDSGRIGVKVA
jgi:hypothetical protein